MKRKLLVLALLSMIYFSLIAQPIPVGSQAPDSSLKNVDGTTVSLSDYANEKGIKCFFDFWKTHN